jgi:hypothetical protein
VVAGVVVVGEVTTAPEEPVVLVSEVPTEPFPVVVDPAPPETVAEWAAGSEAIRTPSPEAATAAVRAVTTVSRRTRVTARSRDWTADWRLRWRPCESCAM